MEEEEACEGVLELLVPSNILGHFLLNRCLLLFFFLGESESCGVVSEPSIQSWFREHS